MSTSNELKTIGYTFKRMKLRKCVSIYKCSKILAKNIIINKNNQGNISSYSSHDYQNHNSSVSKHYDIIDQEMRQLKIEITRPCPLK